MTRKTRSAEPKAPAEEPLLPQMKELSEMVAQLREEDALARVASLVEAGAPADQILFACQDGMRKVGAMHEEGKYFIAGLIMAGEIMRQAVDLLRPVMTGENHEKSAGRVLLGTIKGDIHDIGKSLFKDLLECHGFTVMDLGVDVPPGDFVRAAAEFNPDLIAVSVLITNSFPFLRELVDMLRGATDENTKRPFIMIGGGQVDERVLHVSGCDFRALDAFEGLKLCLQLMENRERDAS